MTSVNSGTITTINNMTAGQGVIVYVEKTVTGGTGLNFNVTGTLINVLAPSVTGKYSFVISKVATNTYILSKPAESLGLA
jgi:ATP-dependent Lon protease